MGDPVPLDFLWNNKTWRTDKRGTKAGNDLRKLELKGPTEKKS